MVEDKEELTARQKEILTRVIESHIMTTLPVGSKTLAEHYGLNLSPASVRQEMGVLEGRGYLTHPHPSAGRMPTDKGYRFYVTQSVIEEPVSEALSDFITCQMREKIENLESLMARISHILSAIAEEAVLLLSPTLKELYLKELSLIPLDSKQLLAIWCSTSGLVQNCLVEMEEPISYEETVRIRNLVNKELAGEPLLSLEDELLRRIQPWRDSLERLYEQTLQIVRESVPHWGVPRLFVEGSHYILNQPEFQDLKKLQLLIEVLEEKSSLVHILTRRSQEGKVHVAIGDQDLSSEMWDCSLVSAPYLWHGKSVGAVGVLGPRRMPYGRMMGLVHQMAEEISQALERWGS